MTDTHDIAAERKLLAFSIEGGFITELARSWFFEEKKNYSQCEELLLSCMSADTAGMGEQEIRELDSCRRRCCLDILEGRSRLKGMNSFHIVPEESAQAMRSVMEELASRHEEEIKALKKQNKALSEQVAELIREKQMPAKKEEEHAAQGKPPVQKMREQFAHCNVIDEGTWFFKVVGDHKLSGRERKAFADFFEYHEVYPAWHIHGRYRYIALHDCGTDRMLTLEEIAGKGISLLPEQETPAPKDEPEEAPAAESYDWLAPDGTFFESGWGTHEDAANGIIEKNGWDEAFYTSGIRLARDFLTQQKGYVLINNPAGIGRPDVSFAPHRITKKQADFLYGYFCDRGDSLMADTFVQYMD